MLGRERLVLWVRAMCVEAEISIQGGRLMGRRQRVRGVRVSSWSRGGLVLCRAGNKGSFFLSSSGMLGC